MPEEDDKTKELRNFDNRLRVLHGKPYAGVLDEPLEPWESLLPVTPGMITGDKHVLGERIAALFEHYEIDPHKEDAWRDLAICLALAHVPGFGLAPVQGRQRTRGRDDIALITFIRILQRTEKFRTSSAAIRRLIDLEIFPGNVETLRRRYIRARERYQDQMDDIIAESRSWEKDPSIMEWLIPK